MLLKHHYPFPTPQSPFPPIIWGKNTCSSANVTVLEGGKQQRRGGFKQGPLCLRARLVSSRLFLAWPRSPAGGKGVYQALLAHPRIASTPSPHLPPTWRLHDWL